MADTDALLRFLERSGAAEMVLTLAQIGAIVGWNPPRGTWTTAAVTGERGSPTPMLLALNRARRAGWVLAIAPDRRDAILFRAPPYAPAPVERAPFPPSPVPALTAAEKPAAGIPREETTAAGPPTVVRIRVPTDSVDRARPRRSTAPADGPSQT